jgi:hypothetical protein
VSLISERFIIAVENKLQIGKVCEVQRKTYKQTHGKKITGLQVSFQRD